MKVIIHIGLDVHNESIAVSLAPSDSTEVRRWGILGGTHEHVQRFVKQLQGAHPDATLKFCYEAGPRGFPLCRFLRALGHECLVVCPSRVPRAPGDRVKTDRRDADQLARLLRAGELTGIHVPELKKARDGRTPKSSTGLPREPPGIYGAGSTPDGKDAARGHTPLPLDHPSALQSFPILWCSGVSVNVRAQNVM